MIDIQTKNNETTIIVSHNEDIMEEGHETKNKDFILKAP